MDSMLLKGYFDSTVPRLEFRDRGAQGLDGAIQLEGNFHNVYDAYAHGLMVRTVARKYVQISLIVITFIPVYACCVRV